MRNNYLIKVFFVLVLGLLTLTNANSQDQHLPLGGLNLNSNGDLNSYDPNTHIIHYGGDWQYYGWTWEARNGVDFSAYSEFTVYFDPSLLLAGGDSDDPYKVQIEIAYMEGAAVSTEGRAKWGTMTVPLDQDRKNRVKYIFIKSQKSGDLKLLDAFLVGTVSKLPLNALNLNSNGDLNSYNPETQTITYGGDWQYYGWTWEQVDNNGVQGKDLSKFNSITINYDPSGLPEFSDGTDPTKIQVEVGYWDGSTQTVEGRNFWGAVTVPLDQDKSNKVKYIFVKSQKAGTLKLLNATLNVSGISPDQHLPLGGLNLNSNGDLNSYDPNTHIIHYGGDWQYYGWTWEARNGVDLSAYNEFTVYFDPSLLLADGDSGDPYKVQIEIAYMEGAAVSTEGRAKWGTMTVPLDQDRKNRVKYIYIKSQKSGDLKLLDAFLVGNVSQLPFNTLNLNSNGDLNSYNSETQTITYGGDWQYYGWTWEQVDNNGVQGKDLSKFNSLIINYDPSGLPEFGDGTDPTKIQVEVGYWDGSAKMVEGRNFWGAITVPLDQDKSNKVKSIFAKSQKSGTLKLLGVHLNGGEQVAEDEILPIEHDYDLGSGSNSSYDAATHTVTFTGEWATRGWWFGSDANGRDLSDYKYAVVLFEPVDFKVQLVAQYNGNPAAADSKALVEAGAKRVVVELNPEARANVQQIYLQSDIPGQVVINQAYLTNKDPRRADLIVSDISWDPANPAPGEEVVFSAKIKNIGDGTSANGKHGVTFALGDGTNPIQWSDSHTTGVPAGSEVAVTATGGPSKPWTVGTNPEYRIKAVFEGDVDSNVGNNVFYKTLVVNGKADLEIVENSFILDPEAPSVGDAVGFIVSVKNIGTVNTPAGVKHGAAFSVNNQVVAWSDNRTQAVLVDREARLGSNGGPNNGDGTWIAKEGTFTFKVEVNDATAEGVRPFEELTYDNNIVTFTLTIKGSDIMTPDTGKNVTVVNGKIQLTGYSENAKVNVYNVFGQQIAKDKNTLLSTGVYLIKVLDEGNVASYKVLVK